MATKRWHTTRTATALTLSRRPSVRWDIAVHTVLPLAGKTRLAHQIRQDMWRKLQSLRGFCPAVRVEEERSHLRITAGGDIAARSFPKDQAEAMIAELFEDQTRVTRWMTNARKGMCHA